MLGDFACKKCGSMHIEETDAINCCRTEKEIKIQKLNTMKKVPRESCNIIPLTKVWGF